MGLCAQGDPLRILGEWNEGAPFGGRLGLGDSKAQKAA